MKSGSRSHRRLEIAYEEHGPANGAAGDPAARLSLRSARLRRGRAGLAADGCRVLVPYLRGYGPTRFLSADTPRSGEQAALGNDLLQFMDALGIGRAALAGYDWGGRAACIVAALWPERVRGLVSWRRLQHPGHRRLGEAGAGRSRSIATGTSTTSTPSAAGPA